MSYAENSEVRKMGETVQAKQILYRDGTVLNNRTIVVEQNYIIVIGANGKREEILPWESIVQIKL